MVDICHSEFTVYSKSNMVNDSIYPIPSHRCNMCTICTLLYCPSRSTYEQILSFIIWCLVIWIQAYTGGVLRQFVYRHFVYDISSTDISSTDISSTTVFQHVGQLYICILLFQQIIIFINSNFYLHYDSFLSIPLPLTL